MHLWEQADWPKWRFNASVLSTALASVRHSQGRLMGSMGGLGFAMRDINDLIERGLLKKTLAGGRSTSYELAIG